MDELFVLIRAWSVRTKLQKSLYWLFFGLACGLGTALVIAVSARIFPILNTSALIAISILCAVLGALCAFLAPWLNTWRTSPSKWAREFDQRFKLKERLSTALELREGIVNTNNDPLRRQQQDDAAQTAQKIDVRKLLPLRVPPRFVLYAAALALALAVTIALPNPQQQVLADKAALQKVIDQQNQQLDAAKQQVQQSQTLTDAQKQQIVQALDDAQKALNDPTTTPEKALAAINDAQSKLDALSDQTTQDQVSDLQRAGQSLTPDQLTNPLANSLENGNLNQAANQTRTLTQNNGQPLTDEQRQRLADQLEQIARNIQNSNSTAANQLQQAAQQLRDKQDQAAQQTLNQVASQMEQTAQKQAAQQQLNNAQTSMEDARRAVSEASQQSQSVARAAANAQNTQQDQSGQQNSQGQSNAGAQQSQQGQKGQPGQQGQQSTSDGSAQSGQSDQPGQSGGAQQPGNAQGSNSPNSISQHHEDVGSDDSVMAPQRINNAGQTIVLPNDKGQNVPNPNAQANPGASNQATVPYQQVYPQYAKTADEAIQNGQVPAELRDYVHDYFSSLDPRQTK